MSASRGLGHRTGSRQRVRQQVAVVGDALPWTCRVESEIGAPVDAVWRLVSDVTRTGEWSHECLAVEWLDGAEVAAPGVRFRGANKSLWLRWHRTCVVTEVEAGRMIAWRTIPTWRFVDATEWRITLEPLNGGTRITQTYEVLRCPRWWEWIVARINPPHRDRTAALAADLSRIGAVAAADASTAHSVDQPASVSSWYVAHHHGAPEEG